MVCVWSFVKISAFGYLKVQWHHNARTPYHSITQKKTYFAGLGTYSCCCAELGRLLLLLEMPIFVVHFKNNEWSASLSHFKDLGRFMNGLWEVYLVMMWVGIPEIRIFGSPKLLTITYKYLNANRPKICFILSSKSKIML